MRRTWAAAAAILTCLALGGLPATGQEASSTTTSVERDQLYEITVPVSAIPDLIGKINVSTLTVAPGAVVSIPYDNEFFLGDVLRLQSGELVVTPAYDAMLWAGDAARGGSPVTAPAGQPVDLSVGDVLLLPAIARDQLDPTREVGIMNPGTIDAASFVLHMHWWEMGPTWPTGISVEPNVQFLSWPELDRVRSGDTVFRLTEMTLQPEALLPFPEDAAFVIDYVERGILDGPAGDSWGPGRGTTRAPSLGLTEISGGGDAPALLLELAAIPSSATAPSESTAPAPTGGSAWVPGTAS